MSGFNFQLVNKTFIKTVLFRDAKPPQQSIPDMLTQIDVDQYCSVIGAYHAGLCRID